MTAQTQEPCHGAPLALPSETSPYRCRSSLDRLQESDPFG